jgi:hypothetical protein
VSDRAAPPAVLVAAVVFAATVAGGAVAARLRADGSPAPTSTTSTSTPEVHDGTAGCVVAAGADPAAVEVCAVDAVVAALASSTDLDAPTAACVADAVVDELGADAVLAGLAGATPPPDLRTQLRAALAGC